MPRRSDSASLLEYLVVFDLKDQAYALPGAAVQEITFMAETFRSAGLPPLLDGHLNLGGVAVPVVDLRRLFGLPEALPTLHTPLVILRHDGHPVALRVDRTRGVITVTPDALVPVDPMRSLNGCIQAELAGSDPPVHVLDPDRLLLQQEQRCVAELQSHEQARLDAVAAERQRHEPARLDAVAPRPLTGAS